MNEILNKFKFELLLENRFDIDDGVKKLNKKYEENYNLEYRGVDHSYELNGYINNRHIVRVFDIKKQEVVGFLGFNFMKHPYDDSKNLGLVDATEVEQKKHISYSYI